MGLHSVLSMRRSAQRCFAPLALQPKSRWPCAAIDLVSSRQLRDEPAPTVERLFRRSLTRVYPISQTPRAHAEVVAPAFPTPPPRVVKTPCHNATQGHSGAAAS